LTFEILGLPIEIIGKSKSGGFTKIVVRCDPALAAKLAERWQIEDFVANEPHIDPIVAELLASLGRLGASQIAIAERAGISPPYLCQIASGKRQPTLDVIHRLADVAGRRLALGRGRRVKGE
jgi:hypothetical protein